jgi:hypothetical protein
VDHALRPSCDIGAGCDHDQVTEGAGLVEEQADGEQPAAALLRVDGALDLDDGPRATASPEEDVELHLGGLHEADGGIDRRETACGWTGRI